MNYIKELNALQQWLMLNNLSSGANLLWRTLLSLNNLCDWKKSFNAPNATVVLLTGLLREEVDDASKQLVVKELILCERGVKRKAAVYQRESFHLPDEPSGARLTKVSDDGTQYPDLSALPIFEMGRTGPGQPLSHV